VLYDTMRTSVIVGVIVTLSVIAAGSFAFFGNSSSNSVDTNLQDQNTIDRNTDINTNNTTNTGNGKSDDETGEEEIFDTSRIDDIDTSYLQDNYLDLSTVEEKCIELIPGHNNLNEKRINLIYVGVNYKNINNLYALVKATLDYNKNIYSLLALEPWKSNTDRFNFFFVNEIGVVNGEVVAKNRGSEAEDEVLRLVSLCGIESEKRDGSSIANTTDGPINAKIVALINWKFGSGSHSPMVRIDYIENKQELTLISKIINHELGHLIGQIEDEYISKERQDKLYEPGKGFKLNGTCYYMPYAELNCEITPTGKGGLDKYTCTTTDDVLSECYETSPWHDLIGNGCGKEGVIDCKESDSDYYNEVGCYLGCKFPNLFMAERKSIMHGGADYGYGLYETRKICNVIKKQIGSVGGICNTLCLSGCAIGEQCIQGICQ